MANTDSSSQSSWEKIQIGVRDTERLIGQKKYNMAMIKARQTLEFMVKCLCEKSDVPEGSLIDMIDALYDEDYISKTTCEHYHKIRTIGNRAIHEEDNSAYNNRYTYSLLSQEVYTFAGDYTERRRRPAPAARRSAGESTRSRTAGSRSTAGSHSTAQRESRRRRAYSSGPSIDPGSIIKPLLLIAIIIVLLLIIRMIRPAEETAPEDTTAAPTVAVETMASTEMPTEAVTEAPTEAPTEAVVLYRTTDTLNVRSTPSTDDARIGVLAPDTEVEFLGDYDDRWCVIRYNGQEAYVVKEYLTPVS